MAKRPAKSATAYTAKPAPREEAEESDEFDPAKFLTLAGPWSATDKLQVVVKAYADNAPKVRIDRAKKNGDMRPARGGFTAAEARALGPILVQAADVLDAFALK